MKNRTNLKQQMNIYLFPKPPVGACLIFCKMYGKYVQYPKFRINKGETKQNKKNIWMPTNVFLHLPTKIS